MKWIQDPVSLPLLSNKEYVEVLLIFEADIYLWSIPQVTLTAQMNPNERNPCINHLQGVCVSVFLYLYVSVCVGMSRYVHVCVFNDM